MSRVIASLLCAAIFLVEIKAQEWSGQGNPAAFTPMGANGLAYNQLAAAQARAASSQQAQAGNDRGENVNMQRQPLALSIQRFPGMFSGGYPGGFPGGLQGGFPGMYPGGFPGGYPGGFPGVFSGGYPGRFGRNPMVQSDFAQERRSNLFGDLAMAAAMTGSDMWLM